jgi:hypothetical protein
MQTGRVVVGGQRMIIRDEKVTFRIMLHLHEIAQRPEIVPQMELSGGPDTAKYYIHTLLLEMVSGELCRRTKVSKKTRYYPFLPTFAPHRREKGER